MTDLPQPSAEGTLEKTPLGQVVAYAVDRKLSGTLALEGGGAQIATLVLRDGWPCKARTKEPHYLGMVLHTMGLIDDTVHNASLARLAKERRPHGQILLEMGAIQPEGLLRALRTQLAEKIEPLFASGPETIYRYYDGVDALETWGGPEVALADPLPILWAGLQRSPPWPHVDARLGRLGGGVALRIATGADIARFRFTGRGRELADLLRQRALTLDEMTATGLIDPSGARLLAYALLLTKHMVLAAAATPPPAARGQSSPSFSPPQMPQVAPNRMPSFASIPSPSVVPAAQIRSSSMPPRTSVPPPGVHLTPELAAFRQRIIDRVNNLQSEDYFQVLGVTPQASIEEAQHAYILLAKVWHPDRLAPQLFDVRQLSEKVFVRMSDARAVLTDPEKRAAYVVSLSQGVRPERTAPVEMTSAAFEFQKADVFLKKRDLKQAEVHCRRAHEADPANADYLALLTWITVETEGPAAANDPKHLQALTRALKMNERCERAYYYRGMLYKRQNRLEKAYLDFKEAAEINPKNIEAAREVHLYQKRHGA